MQIFKYLIALIGTTISAYTDYKYFKIKNNITTPIAFLGIVLSFFDTQLAWWESVLGLIIPFVICLVLYLLKMLRAGDIKLFMAIGALMGWKWIINCMAASILAGGVISVIIVIKRKCLIKRIKKLFNYFKNFFFSGIFVNYTNDEEDKEGLFPFGISILFGTIITIFLELNNRYLFIE